MAHADGIGVGEILAQECVPLTDEVVIHFLAEPFDKGMRALG